MHTLRRYPIQRLILCIVILLLLALLPACTRYVQQQAEMRARRLVGMVDCPVKPIPFDELKEILPRQLTTEAGTFRLVGARAGESEVFVGLMDVTSVEGSYADVAAPDAELSPENRVIRVTFADTAHQPLVGLLAGLLTIYNQEGTIYDAASGEWVKWYNNAADDAMTAQLKDRCAGASELVAYKEYGGINPDEDLSRQKIHKAGSFYAMVNNRLFMTVGMSKDLSLVELDSVLGASLLQFDCSRFVSMAALHVEKVDPSCTTEEVRRVD